MPSRAAFEMPHQHRDPYDKQLGNLMLFLGSSLEPWVPQPSQKNSEAPLPIRRCNFIHANHFSLFPERVKLPYIQRRNPVML